MTTWWLSFVGDEGFRGVSLVDADSFPEAIVAAWRQNVNPGGEVQGMPLPDDAAAIVPESYRGRILPRADALALDGIFAARLAPGSSTVQ